MLMLSELILAGSLATGAPDSAQAVEQTLNVSMDLTAHTVTVESMVSVIGPGIYRFALTSAADVTAMHVNDREVSGDAVSMDPGRETAPLIYTLDLKQGTHRVQIAYTLIALDDVHSGERPGQVHNFAVDAHVAPEGVFLSEGSYWHPMPLDDADEVQLHTIATSIAPIDDWCFVASGDPAPTALETALTAPVWDWRTPRPVDGVAIVGNQHVRYGRIHETPRGPVEVCIYASADREDLVPLILDGACRFLDIYSEKIGPYPFRRFTIVENFFSSGFAFPGYTLIGSNVLDRGPLLLHPGLLDHELVHSWWGSSVYVDYAQGNWCEALTSYCTNYSRRVFDDGPEAGRAYRLGTITKLSADPASLDDGPLASFGSADPATPGCSRFVGYDKGAFIFYMLENVLATDDNPDALWDALQRFAREQTGKRATWDDIQRACEAQRPDKESGWLNGFFQTWVREHHVPLTPGGTVTHRQIEQFGLLFAPYMHIQMEQGTDEHGMWYEIDPDFKLYRALPVQQITPLIGGSMESDGHRLVTASDRAEVKAFEQMFPPTEGANNLVIVGAQAIMQNEDLLKRTGDFIKVTESSFTVDGQTYDAPTQAFMHTMQHPDSPGNYITIFHSNGEVGWQKLRLMIHYRRDTTVIWDDGEVINRRVYEPSRRVYVGKPATT
jgi:hypothetical protein